MHISAPDAFAYAILAVVVIYGLTMVWFCIQFRAAKGLKKTAAAKDEKIANLEQAWSELFNKRAVEIRRLNRQMKEEKTLWENALAKEIAQTGDADRVCGELRDRVIVLENRLRVMTQIATEGFVEEDGRIS